MKNSKIHTHLNIYHLNYDYLCYDLTGFNNFFNKPG